MQLKVYKLFDITKPVKRKIIGPDGVYFRQQFEKSSTPRMKYDKDGTERRQWDQLGDRW